MTVYFSDSFVFYNASTMNIAIIGYGKMGKEVEAIALERKHQVSLKVDIDTIDDFSSASLKNIDVAIEFTRPEAVYKNVLTCFEAGVPVVTGTTGWDSGCEEIKKICIAGRNAFFHSPNFSLGVNIFFRLNNYLAEIMNQFSQYDVQITEVHHNQKLDAPSGTAIKLAEDLLQRIDRKKSWQLNGADTTEKLNITAERRDSVPGIHTITYDSDVDFLQITHSAKNRRGFALGAVIAAEFIKGKTGVFTMDDLLDIRNNKSDLV